MRIAILDLTSHPLPLLAGLPRSAQQIADWLAPVLPEAALWPVDVAGGADLPAPDACDGVVVGGSERGVYDDTEWMAPLRAYLLALRDRAVPVYGICFGHQIMADVFGGRAEKAATGAVIGARRLDYCGTPVDGYFWHQDQVSRVPAAARVTGKADHCPVGALDYTFPARSVQFHPEYRAAEFRDLLHRLRGRDVSDTQVEAAIESFDGVEVPGDLAAREAAQLFRGHAAGTAERRTGS